MKKSDLNFQIIVEAPESDVVINDLDVEFKVKKTIKNDPDIAFITIWNLGEDIYKMLIAKDQQLSIYTQKGDNDMKFLFSGYSDKNFIFRRKLEVVRSNDDSAPPDVQTIIKLVDSKGAYQNAYINENYRENVSSTQIINDCISAMGIGMVNITSKLPEKTYSTFKAVGKPYEILTCICESLGLSVVLQEGILKIGTPSVETVEDSIPELSLTNSSGPRNQGANEVVIHSEFMPELKPNNIVKCSFEQFEGNYKVTEVYSEGNNFDLACITKIKIGLDI